MLNIIYSVYNLQKELKQIHIDNWKQYSQSLLKQINIILIDDCSTKPLTIEINFPINLKIVRILDNVGYNIGGAKNLGFYIVENTWCFSSDIDHVLSPNECLKCIQLDKKLNNLYYFTRYLPNGEHYQKRHDNTYIIHKQDFWKIGGYDEDFTPHYGYEDAWLKYIMQKQNINFINTDIKVILYNIPNQEQFLSYPMEKRKIDREINYKLLDNKKSIYVKPYSNTKILRFNWKIIKEYYV